jgi:hypothetical protein
MNTYGRVVIALLSIGLALLSIGLAAAQDQGGKSLLPGEFDSYNEIIKDINLKNFAKALADIASWRKEFPASAYREEGVALEIQALAETNRPGEALDAVGALMARGLDTVYPGPQGQATVIRLLYAATWAISHLPNPSAEQIATGRNATHQLMDYDRQLPGVSPSQWAQARADMKAKADGALFYLAMLPGVQAMSRQPPDCALAESSLAAALGDYPDRSILSYQLGRALNCQVKDQPGKVFAAIYEFERAASIDPKLGDPNADPSKVQSFADNSYTRVHGSEEGLDRLKQLVKQSPLPPSGFSFPTAAEIAEQKRTEFERDNPQVAIWIRIKGALTDSSGASFFDSQMKDTAMPQLRGTLVEAKPECRPRELLVAVPLPDAPRPHVSEIRLKLDRPLAGKPMLGSEFQWEGVAAAFTQQPFLLTMETEAKNILGLKLDPCSAPLPKKR